MPWIVKLAIIKKSFTLCFPSKVDTTDSLWSSDNTKNTVEENSTFLAPSGIKDGIVLESDSTTSSSRAIPTMEKAYYFSAKDEIIRHGSLEDASMLSCLLCLVVVSLYQKINFLLKLCLMTLTALVQIVIYTCISKSSSLSIQDITSTPSSNSTSIVDGESIVTPKVSLLVNQQQVVHNEWPFWLEPVLLMSLFIVLLHLLDRQIEIMSRSDFLWMTKLRSEEDGGDTMLGINKVIHLLEIFGLNFYYIFLKI